VVSSMVLVLSVSTPPNVKWVFIIFYEFER